MQDEQEKLITVDSLFTVQMMSLMNEVVSENMIDWRVSAMTSREVEI